MKFSYTNPEIANILGTSRANINQILKRAIRKLFFSIIYYDIADTAVDSFNVMIKFLGLDDESDIKELYKKLDDDIKELIKDDMVQKYWITEVNSIEAKQLTNHM